MKKLLPLLAVLLALCALMTSALAYKNCETYGLVTVYSGPWDLYPQLCALPSGMKLQAIEYELNDQDDTLWHLVEFTLGGKVYRGYIENSDPIAFESASGYYEAEHTENIRFMKRDAVVYAAPCGNAAVTGNVHTDENVTVLAEENGYLLIDYEQYGQPCRGYIAPGAVR